MVAYARNFLEPAFPRRLPAAAPSSALAVGSGCPWPAGSDGCLPEGHYGPFEWIKVLCSAGCLAAWPILLEWNARCVPPWDVGELLRKWEYAVKTSKGPRGAKIPVGYIRRVLKVQEDGQKNSPD